SRSLSECISHLPSAHTQGNFKVDEGEFSPGQKNVIVMRHLARNCRAKRCYQHSAALTALECGQSRTLRRNERFSVVRRGAPVCVAVPASQNTAKSGNRLWGRTSGWPRAGFENPEK